LGDKAKKKRQKKGGGISPERMRDTAAQRCQDRRQGTARRKKKPKGREKGGRGAALDFRTPREGGTEKVRNSLDQKSKESTENVKKKSAPSLAQSLQLAGKVEKRAAKERGN